MDGSRFDLWTKRLATSGTRRTLLRGLAGGVLATAGVGRAAQARCPREQPIQCGETCVDLRTDPSNCGRCGRFCGAEEVCYAGRCMTACPIGFEACGGTCLRACDSGQVRLSSCACCTPTTCAAEGIACGELADGCEGTLSCDCGEGLVCCGGQCLECCGHDDCTADAPLCQDGQCMCLDLGESCSGPDTHCCGGGFPGIACGAGSVCCIRVGFGDPCDETGPDYCCGTSTCNDGLCCVPSGSNVPSTGNCTNQCCSGSCSSGTTCA